MGSARRKFNVFTVKKNSFLNTNKKTGVGQAKQDSTYHRCKDLIYAIKNPSESFLFNRRGGKELFKVVQMKQDSTEKIIIKDPCKTLLKL